MEAAERRGKWRRGRGKIQEDERGIIKQRKDRDDDGGRGKSCETLSMTCRRSTVL